jgi:hypothetical protein
MLACNGDGDLEIDLEVLAPGTGEPNAFPLFDVHPYSAPGVLGGWTEVDGIRHLRLDQGEVADHTLYTFDAEGNVFLSGLEGTLLDPPSFWVPTQALDGQVWYQAAYDRTVTARRTDPGVWEFTYEVGELPATSRLRTEVEQSTGFYEAEFPDYGNAVLSWSETAAISELFVGNVVHAEGPGYGRTVIEEVYADITDPVLNIVGLRERPRAYDVGTGHALSGASVVENVQTAHPVDGQLIEGVQRLVLEPPFTVTPAAFMPGFGEGAVVQPRFASDRSFYGRLATSDRLDRAGLVVSDQGRILRPMRSFGTLDASRLERNGDVEFRYYKTTLSGRIERVELLEAGLVRTPLGRIELPSPEASLRGVWERLDGRLEGVINLGPPVPDFGAMPSSIGISIDLSNASSTPIDPLPGLVRGRAGPFPDGTDVVRCADPDLQLASVGPPIFGGCELERSPTSDVLEGTSSTYGAYRFPIEPNALSFPDSISRRDDRPLFAFGADTFALGRTDNAFVYPVYLMDADFRVVGPVEQSPPEPWVFSRLGGTVDGRNAGVGWDWTWYRLDAEPVVFPGLAIGQFHAAYDAVGAVEHFDSVTVLEADGSTSTFPLDDARNLLYLDPTHVCWTSPDGRGCSGRDGNGAVDLDPSISTVHRVAGVRFGGTPTGLVELDDQFGIVVGGDVLQNAPQIGEPDGDEVLWMCGQNEVCRYGPEGLSRAIAPTGPDASLRTLVSTRFVLAGGVRTPVGELEWVDSP